MSLLYQPQSPILFIIFNRPETTVKVFEKIKEARPLRLYIAADGPRDNNLDEFKHCEIVRAIVGNIDWPCEVKRLYRETNLGCKEAVSSAITWFFENEEEGIILEDDCLPANSFFRYCDIMLERYRNDNRIRHIGGVNLQFGKIWGDSSYYFSNLTLVWGWAGWRRVWQDYDKELKKYDENEIRYQLSKIFSDKFILDTWEQLFKKLKAGLIDTWDYQLVFANFFNNGLSVAPNKNLISNIGFGQGSTNTKNAANSYANIPLEELNEIKHPLYILPEKLADFYVLNHEFNLEARYKRHNKIKRRFKRWLKGE